MSRLLNGTNDGVSVRLNRARGKKKTWPVARIVLDGEGSAAVQWARLCGVSRFG